MGDTIALLRAGRLVQFGTAEALYHRPADLFTARFFSDVNVAEARIADGRAESPFGAFPAPGLPAGSGVVALRPTGFDLAPDAGSPGGVAGGGLAGKVVARRFLGDAEAFTLALEGRSEPLRVRLREGTVPPDATRLALTPRAQDALVFESARANA